MKRVIIIIIAFGIFSCEEDFEGRITYQNSYKSKVSAFTNEQMNLMAGTKQEYYIKGGNYKSVTNGSFSDWQLFINKDNKLYTKLSKNDTVFWQDASVFSDTVISFKINKNVTKVCGYDCDELILTGKKSLTKFYYSSKLKLNSKLFEKHKYNSWYDYLKLANAVPLKIIYDNELYGVENIAIDVKQLNLNDTDFILPKGVVLSKSRYK